MEIDKYNGILEITLNIWITVCIETIKLALERCSFIIVVADNILGSFFSGQDDWHNLL